MKGVLSLLALTQGIAIVYAAKCNDNCARAVVASVKAMQASHSADCSSFLRTTVTPATYTSTIFTTITPDTTSTTTTDATSVSYTTYTTTTTTITTDNIPNQKRGLIAPQMTDISNVVVRALAGSPDKRNIFVSSNDRHPNCHSSIC